jgi:Asp-tRNA(Asn)/Glu-tRNA(Gln) amidotransferase A subunit family amidase
MPLGIQMVSGPFGEETLLAAAHWCEAVLNVHLEPPVSP